MRYQQRFVKQKRHSVPYRIFPLPGKTKSDYFFVEITLPFLKINFTLLADKTMVFIFSVGGMTKCKQAFIQAGKAANLAKN